MHVISTDPNTDTSGASPFTPEDVSSGYHDKDPLDSDQSADEEARGNTRSSLIHVTSQGKDQVS